MSDTAGILREILEVHRLPQEGLEAIYTEVARIKSELDNLRDISDQMLTAYHEARVTGEWEAFSARLNQLELAL